MRTHQEYELPRSSRPSPLRRFSLITTALASLLALLALLLYPISRSSKNMDTQTALVVKTIGEPIIAVPDWPIPQPGPTQIQVRITVAGLNPHDQKGRNMGLFVKDSLPAILGSDVVGIVTVAGEGATRFNVDDRVFGQASLAPGSAQKALQEYVVLDEDFVAIVPDEISEDEAVTLPTNLLAGKYTFRNASESDKTSEEMCADQARAAGLIGFFDSDGLAFPTPWTQEGKQNYLSSSSILIIGGGSNCGCFATQLANLAGFGTVVVVGGNDQELKNFGATHVVNRHGDHDTVLQRIRDVVGDDLLYAFDAYNAPNGQHLAINALSNSRTGKLARLVWSRGSVQETRSTQSGLVTS
jgi:NADPH2:quinone reductase